MTESTTICTTCNKPGRTDGMMRQTVDDTTTYYWHTTCAKPDIASDYEVEPAPLPEGAPKPPVDHTVLAAELERDRLLVEQRKLLAESKARIEALEADLALIEQGKLAAERALREETRACLALSRHGMLQLNRDFLALANEMAMLKGEPGLHSDGTRMAEPLIDPKEPFFSDERMLKEYRETMVLDFMNRYRRGAFLDLEKDPEEILVVKARAYEISYKVCCELLAQKNVKLKIQRNVEYDLDKTAKREERIKKETEKADKPARTTRASTPEEKKWEALVKLCGSAEKAREMQTALDAAADLIKKKQEENKVKT